MVKVEGNTEFIYDENELASLTKKLEKKYGKENELAITELFEARELTRLSTELSRLKIDIINYNPRIAPLQKKDKKPQKPLFKIKTNKETKEAHSLKELLSFVFTIGKANIFRGQNNQPSSDKQGIFSCLHHSSKIIKSSVDTRASN